ncbi:MAG TPA: FKBP-type peptidyl-prolyl cis-trans isomerase [Mucilaginibacter sp.]|nr:FKBP-type peptidyl-prolyl cis-trans isomerase [Mucilaginibacter sp.]
MKKNLMFLVIAAVGLASCNGGFKQAPGGLLYNIHTNKGGAKIKAGDFISLNAVTKTDGDSVLFSTYEQGSPSNTVMQGKMNPGDVSNVFQYLAEGDSVTVKTSIDSMVKKGMRRPPIKGKFIVYEIKVEKVIPKGKGKEADSAWNGEVKKYMDGQVKLMAKTEDVKMKKYIADKKLNGTTTADGLFYVVDKPGAGEKPAVGDSVVLFYTGRFLNGKVFESNVKEVAQKNNNYNPGLQYKPIHVPVGVKKVIAGWDEGLQLMSKGEKATFVIPSKLAYGEQGYYPTIPPFSTLIFEVEILDVVHPDPNAPKEAPPAPQLRLSPTTKK